MYRTKSLVYWACREAYYHGYGFIKNFTFCFHYHYLCDRYLGCDRGPSTRKDFCCVCRTKKYCSLEELNDIKHNSLKLQKFCLNIVRDLIEILSIKLTASFWKFQYFYCQFTHKFRTRYTCLRSNLDYLFSSKNIKWNLIDH